MGIGLHCDMPQQAGISIEIAFDLDDLLSPVFVMEGEIRDALTNLVLNAVDAMPEGGTLSLLTRQEAQADGTTRVVLDVRDTGGVQCLAGLAHEGVARHAEHHDGVRGDGGLGLLQQGRVQRGDTFADGGMEGGFIENGARHGLERSSRRRRAGWTDALSVGRYFPGCQHCR